MRADEQNLPNRSSALRDAIHSAVQRSLDEALANAGIPVPDAKERGVVERVSREVTEVASEQTTYEGLIPPPRMLREFDEVLPGLAKQIADMALNEQHHRHRWERIALRNDVFAQSGGMILGWMLAVGCAAASALLAWRGNNWGAGILLSVVAVSMVRTFVVGGWTREPDDPPTS